MTPMCPGGGNLWSLAIHSLVEGLNLLAFSCSFLIYSSTQTRA